MGYNLEKLRFVFEILAFRSKMRKHFVLRIIITGHESQFSGNNLIETLCATFSAYFTGIDNVAAAFNMSTETRWEHFFDTLQVTIPFNTTIFGKANEIIQTLFNNSNGTIGQIPSTIGDGWYFFGPIFAPFFFFYIRLQCYKV